jgi:hypothetical protein
MDGITSTPSSVYLYLRRASIGQRAALAASASAALAASAAQPRAETAPVAPAKGAERRVNAAA